MRTPGNEPFRYYNSGGTPRSVHRAPNANYPYATGTSPNGTPIYTDPSGRNRAPVYTNPSSRTPITTNGRNNNGRYRVPVTRQPNQVMYTQPTSTVTNNYYYSQPYTRSYRNWSSPYLYSNYNYRRGYRYYQPCAVPFLSLGFFAARPYSYYDYARMSYTQPFLYGDDAYYRSAPLVDNSAVTASTPQVASVTPTAAPAQSMEQELLGEISSYVDSHSKDGQFQLSDPAFGGQMWSLDLTEAPAVYSIDSSHYTVVAGFEGTLGDNTIPSAVSLEFFVERENGRWNVKDAWIVSANGIPRAKRFQSPSFPQVRTWQEGALCPFTGQPMVPVSESAAQQG